MTMVSEDPFSHLLISHVRPAWGEKKSLHGPRSVRKVVGNAKLTGLTPLFLPESDNLLPLAPTVLDLCTVSAGGGDRF
jgi:hypothetical protein